MSQPRENGMDNTRSYVPITKGTMISHYKIIEKIGAGGMGEVYLAEDTKLNRKVALKFLPPHFCQDEGCRSRFKREAQAAAVLEHPNIVTIHEVSEHQGRPYIVMQYVEGKSLRDLIKGKELSLDRMIDLAIQICEGLSKAHQAGIIHRDIKPSNIVIDGEDRPKLLDFGLAAIQGSEKLTMTGSTLGTIGYMSPEQIEGKDIDRRSDLFSLGVVFYEMITGLAPFKADNEAATLNSILNDTPEPLNRYKADVPEELQRIIDKALDKDKDTRFQTAAGIISDLRNIKKFLESGSSTTRPQPSIAVLPFTNLSADPEQEYFCDGMAEEIINVLTHVDGLRVVARTSCFAFKGQKADIRDIGRKLNVETLLEGSVRKSGKRLRITAQVIKVSDGYHLWSERYDREMEDIFAIQDEISLAIVEKLKIRLLKEDRAALTKRFTVDAEAHNLYLKGRYFWGKRTREGYEKAIVYFNKAVEIDPNYAQAYAGIAVSYSDLPNYSSFPPSEAYPLAKEAALKALEIDDEIAEAHTALGLIKSDYDWDWAGAEKEFKRAIELNSAYETAHHWYAFLLMYLGRGDEAIAEMRRSHELDPLSLAANRNLGLIYYFSRRFDDALDMLHKAVEMDSDFTYTHFIMGWTYLRKSEFDKAIKALQKERDLTGGVNPIVVLPLGTAYVRMGEREKAEEILIGVEERMKHEYVSPFHLAQLYFALDKIDIGFELLEKAYTGRDIFLRFIKVMPMEEAVRKDPRYSTLLRKMKLQD